MNTVANSKMKGYLAASLLLVTGCASATTSPTVNSVIKQVKSTVEKEKLVSDPTCTDYLFTKDAEKGMDLVDVMEKQGGLALAILRFSIACLASMLIKKHIRWLVIRTILKTVICHYYNPQNNQEALYRLAHSLIIVLGINGVMDSAGNEVNE